LAFPTPPGQPRGQTNKGVTGQTNGAGERAGIRNKDKKETRKNALQGFEDWYSIYPRKKSRAVAEKAFSKVVPALIALPALMEKTRAFAASWESRPEAERKYIPYPASWLNAGSYDDEPDGTKPVSAPIDPLSFTDPQWRKRLDHLRDCEEWMPRWGPKPGEPGCLVPSHLLIVPVSKSNRSA
jgi:hypothetical protein